MRSFLDPILSIWENEPVVVISVVDAFIALAVSFGLPLTMEQKTAIDTVVVAVGVFLARSQVIPVSKLP